MALNPSCRSSYLVICLDCYVVFVILSLRYVLNILSNGTWGKVSLTVMDLKNFSSDLELLLR